MEEINHFSHKSHPLKLLDPEKIVGASVNGGEEKSRLIGCYACEKPISNGFAYACIQCRYFLHKSCAQLPLTINDPSLYHHQLTLTDLKDLDSRYWKCAVCCIRKKSRVFSYTFKNDDLYIFGVCIDCCVVRIARKAKANAIKEEAKMKVQHEGHPQHTLTLQLRPAAFRCDACNSMDEGLFFQCDSCDFWIHKTCASLVPIIHLPHHPDHELVLRPSSTKRDVSTSTSFVDEDAEDLLEFPMLEAFMDPLKLLHLDKTCIHDDKTEEIKHWSHHHPLILNNVHQFNMYGMISSNPLEVCHGCVQPLSLPYYTCKDGCSFTFHKYCTELPLKLQHPLHSDHSLDLINLSGHSISYKCIGCFTLMPTAHFYPKPSNTNPTSILLSML
ncbi:unnamed protein product [Lactuca saligna]|uniref:Phorbol-ester/DAG-type domain-containing protein n=1 Tax=Lactuca saligna TaxID=75948 RepID=A0AA36ECB7_LACSI|nr:unnamed protein product [Lactuca saligna]